ncbi:hypothetical protein CFRA_00450 [Corynebacterium frankenforstense DSM 45800]|uniref:Uncharacterized protein n=1 Tax=Corynebacterium frankenforstense DSM 45800 TaxID=1437875 RepID=A0A1L7CQ93_9CORY|nr:hypothetical protein [Corynebacterium frankenforstense]APT88013.1 hypothetical protein CFRA_00450 [Corynebacterium frankenforstense DSM 45800]
MADIETADITAAQDSLAPGVLGEVCDEKWLATSVNTVEEPAGTAYEVHTRGVSDYVRDQTATFFTSLEPVEVIDPTDVTRRRTPPAATGTPASGSSPRCATPRCRSTSRSSRWRTRCCSICWAGTPPWIARVSDTHWW